jgi:hypothetical protein
MWSQELRGVVLTPSMTSIIGDMAGFNLPYHSLT